MKDNWLFQFPDGDFDEQKAIIQARVESDPGALLIPDEEAEAFFVSAMALAHATPEAFALYARAFGMPGQPKNKVFRRQATLLILRAWRQPRMQQFLRMLRTSMRFDDLPSAEEGPAGLSLDDLKEAYYRGHNAIWLCSLLRLTDRADQIPTLLARLDDWTAELYAIHLNVGRLMFRRILDGVGVQAAKSNQSTHHLKAQLKQKRDGLARARREMRDQQARLTRQERLREAKAVELARYLDELRQEVAAAESRLVETLTRQATEADLLRQEHATRLAELAAETERVEASFAQALGALSTAWPLAGLRVAIVGDWGEAERLLISTAGGHVVAETADQPDLVLYLGRQAVDNPSEGRFFTPERGPQALERLLNRNVLPLITRFRPS